MRFGPPPNQKSLCVVGMVGARYQCGKYVQTNSTFVVWAIADAVISEAYLLWSCCKYQLLTYGFMMNWQANTSYRVLVKWYSDWEILMGMLVKR